MRKIGEKIESCKDFPKFLGFESNIKPCRKNLEKWVQNLDAKLLLS